MNSEPKQAVSDIHATPRESDSSVPVKRQKRVLGPPRRGMWGARRPLPRPAREPRVPSQGRGRLERRVTGGAGSRSVRGIAGPRGSEGPKPAAAGLSRGGPSQGSLRRRGGRLSVPPWGEAQPLVARAIGPGGEANGLQGPPGSAPLPAGRVGTRGPDGAACAVGPAGQGAGGTGRSSAKSPCPRTPSSTGGRFPAPRPPSQVNDSAKPFGRGG